MNGWKYMWQKAVNICKIFCEKYLLSSVIAYYINNNKIFISGNRDISF